MYNSTSEIRAQTEINLFTKLSRKQNSFGTCIDQYVITNLKYRVLPTPNRMVHGITVLPVIVWNALLDSWREKLSLILQV